MALTSVVSVGQSKPEPIDVATIHHTRIQVTDLARSLDWYQKLFGLPIVARDKKSVILQIGQGPQFLAIDESRDRQTGISQIGLGVKDFDAARLAKRLDSLGVPISRTLGPRKARIEPHAAAQDDASVVGDRLALQDPDGITIRLGDSSDTGKRGRTAEQSGNGKQLKAEAGILQLQDFNHFTSFITDQTRTVAFYRQVFRLPIDTYQGAMPLLRVGSGNQFLAFVGAGGRSSFRPFIHHVCFSVKSFDPDRVLKKLDEFGVSRRTTARGPVRPLESYVTMRMPDRGGAPGGTPELYFSDPDGILLQLQDVRYNGGSGFLGDKRGRVTSSVDR